MKEMSKPESDLYSVLLLNDDVTPAEFVIDILQSVFVLDFQKANDLMLCTHNDGIAECGSYLYEEASKKVAQVTALARKNQHPLQCVLERQS